MVRCSTPTHTFKFNMAPTPSSESVGFANVIITYWQNGAEVLEKTMKDITFDTEPARVKGKLCWFGWYTLTQEETKKFKAPEYNESYTDNYNVEIQVKVLLNDSNSEHDGTVKISRIINVPVDRVLNEDKIEPESEVI